MSDFKPKQGENIQVLGISRLWLETPRVFIAMHKGRYLCEQVGSDEEVEVWPAARSMPTKPEPIPFTHETWPKQVVWVRKSTWVRGSLRMVVGINEKGPMADGIYASWGDMSDSYEMSLDYGHTWQLCHYVPEE